jgi:hypothetical protein
MPDPNQEHELSAFFVVTFALMILQRFFFLRATIVMGVSRSLRLGTLSPIIMSETKGL